MILDSNIIIYSAIPENENLRDFIAANSPFASEVSRVEVLGYHKLTDQLNISRGFLRINICASNFRRGSVKSNWVAPDEKNVLRRFDHRRDRPREQLASHYGQHEGFQMDFATNHSQSVGE